LAVDDEKYMVEVNLCAGMKFSCSPFLPAAQRWTSHCLFGSLAKEHRYLRADAGAHLARGRHGMQKYFKFDVNTLMDHGLKAQSASCRLVRRTAHRSKHQSSSNSFPKGLPNNWHCSLLSHCTLAPAYKHAL